jgi:hypothetical protein
VVWGHSGDDGGGNAFIGFSPDDDNRNGTFGRWTNHFPNKLPGIANHNAMQIDPVRDLIVVSVHARDALHAIDPADPGREIERLESAGTKPVLQPYAAMEYAPNLACLVYFSPLDGGIVYTIAEPQERRSRDALAGRWNWHACRSGPEALDPIADAASRSRYPVNLSQTFGRFRIVSFGTIDLAILVRHVDSPVYVMRMT